MNFRFDEMGTLSNFCMKYQEFKFEGLVVCVNFTARRKATNRVFDLQKFVTKLLQ